jgi:t-SNARE complex subunit (syntaxin)
MSIAVVSDRATSTDRVTASTPKSRKDRSFSYLCTFAALGFVVSILSVALAGLAIAE